MSDSKQIEDALFFTALHIPDHKLRREFLDHACAGDAALRRAVEEMLAAMEGGDQLLDRGLSAIVQNCDDLENQQEALGEDGRDGLVYERIGTRIGPYLLKESLGRGGCGEVYLAEQQHPVRRQVALKIIKLGMDTRSVMMRFEAEQQALALMDHPYIARVLDAGSTVFGRPYFVLELVKGTPITDFCNQHGLTLRERVELMIKVCQAIQHAHQKGIIHRDIKPSNVLVSMQDGIPLPKVIDFGIAKAIEGDNGDETAQTLQGQLLGTPAYMSPEQADTEKSDIDTRSDIYSLGALLYEIVTGHPPFDMKEFKGVLRMEVPRLLAAKEPVCPSLMVAHADRQKLAQLGGMFAGDASRLAAMIRGDLDWIIMRAMEKERSRRYETVNGLAFDLRNFLNNQPVIARPPGRMYVLMKFIKRNRAIFASATLILLVLVLALAVSTALFFKAHLAELRQRELRTLAEKALANEANLRREAEIRSQLTEAVAHVRQNDFEGAARILEKIETPPREPSLDAITALRDVGMWLGGRKRWAEASRCFEWLLEIDKLDPWSTVTLNYQACGVLLAKIGQPRRYQRFCKILTHAHENVVDGDEAGRILKSCLLQQLDPGQKSLLEHMADVNQEWLRAQPDFLVRGWGTLPMALWSYRSGDWESTIRYCEQGAAGATAEAAYLPSYHAIEAMAYEMNGDKAEASRHFNLAQSAMQRKCSADWGEGTTAGYWYDWLFAAVLVQEASELLETPLGFSMEQDIPADLPMQGGR